MKPIAPMLCGREAPPLDGQPFRGKPGYAYEIKWDGYRLQTIKSGDTVVVLFGRSANDVTDQFPEFVEAVRRIPVDCILDGEAVVMRDGWPSFQDFQCRGLLSKARRAADLKFIAFDVLVFGDTSCLKFPYSERRKALEALVAPAAPEVIVGPSSTDGKAMWDFVVEHQLEGLIAKPLNSIYQPGYRGLWTKIKRMVTEEFVIFGYTPGVGKREGGISTVLVAEREGDRLRPVGAVGTGFPDGASEVTRRMDAVRAAGPSPLLTTKVMGKGIVWTEPVLLCKVAYQERTNGNTLRGPAVWGGLV